jgi:hypothetical protein
VEAPRPGRTPVDGKQGPRECRDLVGAIVGAIEHLCLDLKVTS